MSGYFVGILRNYKKGLSEIAAGGASTGSNQKSGGGYASKYGATASSGSSSSGGYNSYKPTLLATGSSFDTKRSIGQSESEHTPINTFDLADPPPPVLPLTCIILMTLRQNIPLKCQLQECLCFC